MGRHAPRQCDADVPVLIPGTPDVRTIILAAAAGTLLSVPAVAHEHWILAEPAYPQAGAEVRLTLGSGHSFPASEIVLGEKLLVGTAMSGPAGAPVPYEPARGETAWGAVATPTAGTWRAEYALQKPMQDAPLHRSRCLVVAGGKDDPAAYADGKGIEIVPRRAVSGLKPGDRVPLDLRLDGAPASGRITVAPERGGVSFLSAAKDRPAELKVGSPGWYLLGVSHQGRTFTLTFHVRDAGAAP